MLFRGTHLLTPPLCGHVLGSGHSGDGGHGGRGAQGGRERPRFCLTGWVRVNSPLRDTALLGEHPPKRSRPPPHLPQQAPCFSRKAVRPGIEAERSRSRDSGTRLLLANFFLYDLELFPAWHPCCPHGRRARLLSQGRAGPLQRPTAVHLKVAIGPSALEGGPGRPRDSSLCSGLSGFQLKTPGNGQVSPCCDTFYPRRGLSENLAEP